MVWTVTDGGCCECLQNGVLDVHNDRPMSKYRHDGFARLVAPVLLAQLRGRVHWIFCLNKPARKKT